MTICLNMIVKNERSVIARCLASVLPLIDTWVIVDTGSTDGTQDLIRECLQSVPGELFERPWVNFGHNRNEALQLAKTKGEYLLLIDADDHLSVDPSFGMPKLTKDVYIVVQRDSRSEVESQCLFLVKASLPWRWEGVAHEGLVSEEAKSAELVSGVVNVYGADGHRSQNPEKIRSVIELLYQEWLSHPEDGKAIFYLAESYREIKEYEKSLAMYEKRIALGGFAEEIFWSLYCIAKIYEAMEASPSLVLQSYIKAHESRPTRMEPIYDIILLYRRLKETARAYALAKKAFLTPIPRDVLFLSRWIYEWGLLWQYLLCCLELNLLEEARPLVQRLLAIPAIPDSLRNYLRTFVL